MKKKILALLLAAATAVSMAGCGGAASSDTSADTSASTDTQTTDTTADSSAEEETLDWSKYDALIDQIRTDTDFADRVDLMHQAEDMLMSTWAVIPIYYYNDIYMIKPNVSGMYDTVYGIKYFQGAHASYRICSPVSTSTMRIPRSFPRSLRICLRFPMTEPFIP